MYIGVCSVHELVCIMQCCFENVLCVSVSLVFKLSTVAICIRIGVGLGSVETVLHIVILSI